MADNLGNWTLSPFAALVGNGAQEGWLWRRSAVHPRAAGFCKLPELVVITEGEPLPQHASRDVHRRLSHRRRATPFGLFADVTAATVAPAAANIASGRRSVTRADSEWLTMLIDQIEQHQDLLAQLMVRLTRPVRVALAAAASPIRLDAFETPRPFRDLL